MKNIEHKAPGVAHSDAPQAKTRRRLWALATVCLIAIVLSLVTSTMVAGGQTDTVARPRVWPATAHERQVRDEAITARNVALLTYWTNYWHAVSTWVDALVANQQREAAAKAAQTHHTSSSSARVRGGCSSLEDCRTCVTNHESATAGLYQAYNSSGGAAGRYQVMPETWAGFGGYASAVDAPPEVQNEWFNQAYAKYHGTSGWTGLYTDGC